MAIGRQHDRYCTLGGGVWLPSPLRPQDVAVAIGSRTGRRESPRPAKAASEVPRRQEACWRCSLRGWTLPVARPFCSDEQNPPAGQHPAPAAPIARWSGPPGPAGRRWGSRCPGRSRRPVLPAKAASGAARAGGRSEPPENVFMPIVPVALSSAIRSQRRVQQGAQPLRS